MPLLKALQWLAPAALALHLLLAAPLLLAHAQPEGSLPAHGSTVSGSPNRIAVWFDHPMRLTLFEVSGPRGVVPLTQGPGRDALTRFETSPAAPLGPGRYTVRWRGLAADGHVMADEIYFNVR
ncbi:copper resistance CopC family protein [Serpentinimonas maccroryi]|jgi:methionine-rich copper-binding protein CopC|uniref:copper resistance CopC family protein n=1 Tax=Serpentinimonas maccroryi TaxID=1458426 RepID=UPI0020344200|nr:copper resistance CopC family protein [Serpentinimonas maccroryi]MCM2479064.1 copper resistance protein CopC [Serpentinimonas maccroryi]